MFIRKKQRLAVYSYLFKEGVCVASKDPYKPSHDEIEEVTNLEVLCLMKSLTSRGYTRETFNWQYLYYYLTDEGIQYLQEYLHLPEEVQPATLKKAASRPARPGPTPGDRPEGMRGGGKGMGPGGDFQPSYEGGDSYRRGGGGGFGRGGGGDM